MKYFVFIIKSALEDFRRNKIRTFLTSLGILIGVASVVLLIAFGLGLKKFISNQFESLGTDLVILFPGQVLQNGRFRAGGGAGFGARFDERDVINLKKIANVAAVVPIFTRSSVKVSSATGSELGDLYATTADIFPVRNLEPEYGTVFIKADVDKRAKVAVIGPKLAEKIFKDPTQALGKMVEIENQTFRIVGVLKSKGGGGFGGPDFDSFVYVPYKTSTSYNDVKKFFTVIIKPNLREDIDQVKRDVDSTLLKRYKKDDFSVAEQAEILSAISSIFGVLNGILVAIAAISLVVGGIGIMNIMYVSVIERIREIGIRRALGATRNDILLQFLSESVILSLFGGLLGLALSFGIVAITQQFFPAYIDLNSILISLGVSSVIGIVFGVFPARKAALLSPIEAIRYE